MGIMRCPLDNESCRMPITVQGDTFFLAESAAPAASVERRRQLVHEAVGQRYQLSSAAGDDLPPGFSCELCRLIQGASWCLADISGDDPFAMLAAGMMLALGRPVVILAPPETPLALPDEIRGLRVIRFGEYIDAIQPLREALDQIGPMIQPDDTETSVEDTETPEIQPEEVVIPGIHVEEIESSEATAEDIATPEITPDDPVELYNRAAAAAEEGDYEAAVTGYTRALRLRPDDPTTLCDRGNAYTNLEDYTAALEDLDLALELKPGYAAALGNRGIVHTYLDHREAALADYLAALKARPDDANIRYNAACVLALLERTDECLRELETAIMLDADNRDLARDDTDFDSVRDDRRFKVMMGEAADPEPEAESEPEAGASAEAPPTPEESRAANKTHAVDQVRMVLKDEG